MYKYLYSNTMLRNVSYYKHAFIYSHYVEYTDRASVGALTSWVGGEVPFLELLCGHTVGIISILHAYWD